VGSLSPCRLAATLLSTGNLVRSPGAGPLARPCRHPNFRSVRAVSTSGGGRLTILAFPRQHSTAGGSSQYQPAAWRGHHIAAILLTLASSGTGVEHACRGRRPGPDRTGSKMGAAVVLDRTAKRSPDEQPTDAAWQAGRPPNGPSHRKIWDLAGGLRAYTAANTCLRKQPAR